MAWTPLAAGMLSRLHAAQYACVKLVTAAAPCWARASCCTVVLLAIAACAEAVDTAQGPGGEAFRNPLQPVSQATSAAGHRLGNPTAADPDPRAAQIVFSDEGPPRSGHTKPSGAAADPLAGTRRSTGDAKTQPKSAPATSGVAASNRLNTATAGTKRRDLPGPALEVPAAAAGDSQQSRAAPSVFASLTSERPVSTALAGLAIALGSFFLLLWALRRIMPKSATRLPGEVVEVLGHAPLSGKQSVHVLRFGGKLVLVAMSPSGPETISEVTHPEEVQRILAVCQKRSSHSSTAAFRELLQQAGSESRSRRKPSEPRDAAAAAEGPVRFSLWEGRDA